VDNVELLTTAWLNAKKAETEAIEWRRKTEDSLLKLLGIAEQFEGTENFDIAGHKVKIIGRMSRKVDSDRLQELAAEHGLSSHLPALFRWKPEINATAWKSTDASITNPLLAAVTTTPGRPSFSISLLEK
jgi:hypothetical protein